MNWLGFFDRLGWHFITSKILLRMFLKPVFFQRPPAEQSYWDLGTRIDFPSGAEGRFYEPQESRLDRLIVMIHGWSGRGSQFNEVAPLLLAAGYSVLLMDCLGHSESSSKKVSRVHLWSFTTALREDLEFFSRPVHCLVGHSFGGCAAALLAECSPIPQRILLIGAPNRIDQVTLRFANRFKVSSAAHLAFVHRLEKSVGKSQSELDPAGRVARLKTPVAVVHDRNDKEIPFDEGQAIVAARENVRFYPTQGLGHRRILRSPELARAVIAFCEA